MSIVGRRLLPVIKWFGERNSNAVSETVQPGMNKLGSNSGSRIFEEDVRMPLLSAFSESSGKRSSPVYRSFYCLRELRECAVPDFYATAVPV